MNAKIPQPLQEFYDKRKDSISSMKNDKNLQDLGVKIMRDSGPHNYAYNFDWLGVPAIQLPTDMVAVQELIWKLKPQVIIETGVAHGGSIIFYASLLKLIDEGGIVIGVDIDIRKHNRDVIEAHKLSSNIHLIEGSSIDDETIKKIR
jgi:cephalosporin hydroxylase